MKKLVSILALVSACSASVMKDQDDVDGDGDSDGDGDNDSDDDMGEPPVESATVRFLVTAVRDERGDTIDFSTGEPVHTHAGAPLAIGTTGCPDIYKYGYLMSATAPKFGEQTSPNPLQWKVEIKNASALDMDKSMYRVRAADDSIVFDWVKLPALAADVATITLHRDGANAIGERTGQMYLDVRTHEKTGTETVTSACFTFHPLAAPLEVQQASADSTGLAGMSFAASSPISRLVGSTGVTAFSQRFVHHTSEPIALSLSINLPAPAAAFTKRVVHDWVAVRTASSGVLCSSDFDGFESSDPVCTQTPPTDGIATTTTTGPLATGAWTLAIVNDVTGEPATACTVSGLQATCQLPPRDVTAAAQEYRIVLALRDVGDLAPSDVGPYGEHTIGGLTFTGRIAATAYRCAEYQEVTKNGFSVVSCRTHVEYQQIHALDHARLAFGSIGFAMSVSPNPSVPATPPAHLAPGTQSVAQYSWNAGDDDLPGPQ